ncbi:fibroblast growth factor-binding protein 1-like [Myxocyprinus asiaticus]|uniref:fibroblast growth factor-binding protein 1-like n=1 Tax=Myxocyprinus asiaticus TaxID=70543 RepID=UPI002222328E|nr:fibroblast growth factor-binding protein 1-like [Myxocyprinus asiaticus]XP_051502509.1 fibroblast growth factor-binding protein 1-like [Myxocyprinus asiaticus]XP_051502510.1 fibroblast growth factor-binding protein 1-like [Myxocyprinus asiaticus]XP_051502511.1 fibroblast growth factor-binding protein 1-like [Myxocyprinus asiaticus]
MQGRSLLFIFSLLFLLLSFSEEKKKSKQPSDAVTVSDSTPVKASLESGQLSTKDGRRCTWEMLERGANILLQVSCSPHGKEGLTTPYTCQFAGKPQECSIYSIQSSQYWKQVVSKLKKRKNACEGEKVLKTRLCKKTPNASHMKLTERSVEETTTHVSKGMREENKRKTDVPTRKGKEVEKENEEEVKTEEDEGVVNDRFSDMEPATSYCGEGWHSICSFFVKFFDD